LTWVLRGKPLCQNLGHVKSFPPDTVSFVSCVPAFVVVTASEEPIVFLARTPHLAGESLRWDARNRVFYSPLHGERFDVLGRLLSGPALRDLWRCPVTINSEELWIVVSEGTSSEDVKKACSL
jgi:Rieske Fe-S protein